MNALMWNIKSVNTQKTFTMLIIMDRRHQFWFIGLIELFQVSHNNDDYKRRLGIKYAVVNTSGKNLGFYGLNNRVQYH